MSRWFEEVEGGGLIADLFGDTFEDRFVQVTGIDWTGPLRIRLLHFPAPARRPARWVDRGHAAASFDVSVVPQRCTVSEGRPGARTAIAVEGRVLRIDAAGVRLRCVSEPVFGGKSYALLNMRGFCPIPEELTWHLGGLGGMTGLPGQAGSPGPA